MFFHAKGHARGQSRWHEILGIRFIKEFEMGKLVFAISPTDGRKNNITLAEGMSILRPKIG